jgi:formylmethanofuran dehydrogenase subunit E
VTAPRSYAARTAHLRLREFEDAPPLYTCDCCGQRFDLGGEQEHNGNILCMACYAEAENDSLTEGKMK